MAVPEILEDPKEVAMLAEILPPFSLVTSVLKPKLTPLRNFSRNSEILRILDSFSTRKVELRVLLTFSSRLLRLPRRLLSSMVLTSMVVPLDLSFLKLAVVAQDVVALAEILVVEVSILAEILPLFSLVTSVSELELAPLRNFSHNAEILRMLESLSIRKVESRVSLTSISRLLRLPRRLSSSMVLTSMVVPLDLSFLKVAVVAP